MDETQKKDEKAPQIEATSQRTATPNINEGQSLIDQANFAAERLERANAEQKRLIIEANELYAKQRLGGRTEAGLPVPVPKEETPREYAKRIFG